MVPREDLKAVVKGYTDCIAFAEACEDRVKAHERNQQEALKIISEQEARVLAHRDEVDALKRQRNVLTPIAAALAGIALGYFYQKQQD